MKAHPSEQWRLLDVQGLDTRLAQIQHRLANLPEHQRVQQLEAEQRAVQAELISAQTDLADLQREITRADADVALVRERALRNRRRLDEGTAPPKELTALQHELASLERRQAELEDIQLEIMERAETLESHIAERTTQLAAADAHLAAATKSRQEAHDTLQQEAQQLTAQRGLTVPGLPADLVALYDKLREQTGIGAAALREQRCEGCRLQLTGADLARIAAAPADEVLRCEECRRILIRTPESTP